MKKRIIFGLIFIIILIFIVLLYKKPSEEKVDSVKTLVKIKEKKKEELNRYTYKDGFYFEDISSDIKKKITGKSFPSSFDSHYTSISYDDLKYLRINYYDFNSKEHKDGEMIVHTSVAKEVIEIFYILYENKYPIAKMKLVEDYNANDELSMSDNNTSAFNYRLVENSDKLSWHCFGLAIDINPLYNPYVTGNDIYPKNSEDYVDRSKDFSGKIDYNDLAYKTFTEYGWKWGGNFYGEKDYQHFYKENLDASVRERR